MGGSQIDEEGALLLVEWRFPAAERAVMIQRLGDILGQPWDRIAWGTDLLSDLVALAFSLDGTQIWCLCRLSRHPEE